MMTLKNTLSNLFCSGLCLCLISTGWAQKPVSKQVIRTLTKPPAVEIHKNLLAQTRLYMQQHQGKLPRTCISLGHGRPVSVYDLSPEQQLEVRLARQVHFRIMNASQPPDEYLQQLQEIYGTKAKKEPVPSPEEFLVELQAWVEAHNGFRPRLNIYENGKQMPAERLKQQPALYEEHTLARRLDYFFRIGVKDKETREALAAIRNLPTVTRWENPAENQFYDGFGNALPAQYELLNKLQTWSAAHGNTKPRALFYRNGKLIPVQELKENPELYEEYQLGYRFRNVLDKKGQPADLRRALNAFNDLPNYRPNK